MRAGANLAANSGQRLLEAHAFELTKGIGVDENAGAHFPQGRGLLEDGNVLTALPQGIGCRQARDASTNDCYAHVASPSDRDADASRRPCSTPRAKRRFLDGLSYYMQARTARYTVRSRRSGHLSRHNVTALTPRIPVTIGFQSPDCRS